MSYGISHSVNLSDPRLHVVRYSKDVAKTRKLYALRELSGNLSLAVNNPDIDTLRTSLLTRMFACRVGEKYVQPPTTDRGLFVGRMNSFRVAIVSRVGRSTRLSLSAFVETYSGRRRTIYEQAVKDFILNGIRREHSRSVSFVKMELVNPDGAPRCIQPRHPVYNVCLGRYIKAVEHKLYRAADRAFGDGPTIMKGYNVSQIGNIIRGKWRSFTQPVAVGLDAVKFDMHVMEVQLGWEHSIYTDLFPGDKFLKKLLRWQMDNIGSGYCADGKLTYRVRGKRFSGDMNTGLGNCLIMCGLVFSYAEHRGLSVKLVNNGDDCVVFMEKSDLAQFLSGLEEWFYSMGFRIGVETPVYELHQVEFCQMHPIEIGDECRMVRNIPKALRKDTLTTHDLTNRKLREKWCTAVGTGGLWLTGGVPIVQDFYQAMQRIGCMRPSRIRDDPTFATGMKLLSRGMSEKYREPTPWTRCQVYEAWGILPDEQRALEEMYQRYVFNDNIVYGVINNTLTTLLLGP